ncbi:hypothetical protein AB0E78_22385 [Streptomyces sp. NPDC032198]|uniref:hypothetical protein n=1 Tax=Streptomyces sp. NPDC032198 TaxID=3155127 RepID=UPI0033E994EE
MPKPIPMNRRTWVAGWAVLCVAGFAATATMNASSTPDTNPEKPACAEYIAHVDAELTKAKEEGMEDGVVGLSRVQGGTENDCSDELRDYLSSDR